MVSSKDPRFTSHFHALGKIGQVINSETHLNKLLQSIDAIVRETLAASSFSLAHYNQTADTFDWLFHHDSGPPSNRTKHPELNSSMKTTLLHKRVVRSVAPAVTRGPQGNLQELIVPMIFQEDLVGLVCAGTVTEAPLTEFDEQFLGILAAHLAMAFDVKFISKLDRDKGFKEKIEAAENKNRKLLSIVEIARSIAHEFNQPLTGISGYCTLILEEMEEKTSIVDDISEIQKQAARLENLVYKFQNIAHVEYLEGKAKHFYQPE